MHAMSAAYFSTITLYQILLMYSVLTESRTIERNVRTNRMRNCVRKLVANVCVSLPEFKVSSALCCLQSTNNNHDTLLCKNTLGD